MKITQNFYKQTVSVAWATGTGNRYVSVKPTPTAGWLVISPNNSTLREIIEYTNTGTDGGGDYVVVSARGVGGTTEQTHEVGESVRMNMTAEYYADIESDIQVVQTNLDNAVLAGASHASDTVEGISFLSATPASPTVPIALGVNDSRVPTTAQLGRIPTSDQFDALSGGGSFGTPNSSNKYVTQNYLTSGVSVGKFGGNGADGALNITSGTTTINLGGAAIVTKNYTSINISSGATLNFSNPHTNGTRIILKSQGAVTVAGTIDASGMGAAGGTAGAISGNGTDGENALQLLNETDAAQGLRGDLPITPGAGGAAWSYPRFYANTYTILGKFIYIAPGAGGGGGTGGENNDGGGGAGAAGGRGGGAIYMECGGALNFSGTINTSGLNGSKAPDIAAGGNNDGSGGGGGGGSAGMIVVLYSSLTANTGTLTSAGGNGGDGGAKAGSSGGQEGQGGGGAGSLIAAGGSANDNSGGSNAGGLGAGGAGGGGRTAVGVAFTGGTGGATMGGLVIANTSFF